MSFWNVLKVSASFILLGYLSIAIVSGVISAISTGNFEPILKNTLGILVDSDNAAYSATQEIIDTNKHALQPDKYSDGYLIYLKHKIVMNFAIMFLVIYSLYKLFSFLSGIHADDPSTKVMIIGFAILSYFVLSAIYNVLLYLFFKQPGQNILWNLIPLKGAASSLYHIFEIFSIQAPSISLTATETSVANITNATGAV